MLAARRHSPTRSGVLFEKERSSSRLFPKMLPDALQQYGVERIAEALVMGGNAAEAQKVCISFGSA